MTLRYAQTQTGQAPTATVTREALRASAVFAKKLYAPQGTQVFNLAVTRAASAQQSARQGAQQSAQEGAQQSEAPNEGPTLTTDQEDYQPYTYVYFTGTGFQPGETVNMIVVELDPIQQSFQPWDVVADENGNFQTSWYVFSEEFRGATLQATATGDTSGLTASARFTDAAFNYSPTTQSLTASAGGPAVSFTQNVMTSGSNHGQAFGATLQTSPLPRRSHGFDVAHYAELRWDGRDEVVERCIHGSIGHSRWHVHSSYSGEPGWRQRRRRGNGHGSYPHGHCKPAADRLVPQCDGIGRRELHIRRVD